MEALGSVVLILIVALIMFVIEFIITFIMAVQDKYIDKKPGTLFKQWVDIWRHMNTDH